MVLAPGEGKAGDGAGASDEGLIEQAEELGSMGRFEARALPSEICIVAQTSQQPAVS